MDAYAPQVPAQKKKQLPGMQEAIAEARRLHEAMEATKAQLDSERAECVAAIREARRLGATLRLLATELGVSYEMVRLMETSKD